MALDTFPSGTEPFTAEAVITRAVQHGGGAEAILHRLEQTRGILEQGEAMQVQQYIAGIRPQIEGVLVHTLDAGVGGEFSGQGITIATDTLFIDQSIEKTIARTEETREHEEYHKEHDHLAPLQAEEGQGSTVATIGGHAFTHEALIEGMTVVRTGEQFVSEQYRQYAANVRSSVAAAGITLEAMEEAIDDKNLLSVMDAYREEEVSH